MKWFLIVSALSLTAFYFALRRRPLPPAPNPLGSVDEFGTPTNAPTFQAKSLVAGNLFRRTAQRPAAATTATASGVSPLHALAPDTFDLLYAGQVIGKVPYQQLGKGYTHAVLPEWYNTTSVAQGGFVGPAADRKTIYQVYGDVYSGGFKPPGWFGYTTSGIAIEFSSTGSEALAKGVNAIGAEQNVLARYPFADKPPNFNPVSK